MRRMSVTPEENFEGKLFIHQEADGRTWPVRELHDADLAGQARHHRNLPLSWT